MKCRVCKKLLTTKESEFKRSMPSAEDFYFLYICDKCWNKDYKKMLKDIKK
jgi:hypothetical protein